jgi:uncharacterized metal-binding protein
MSSLSSLAPVATLAAAPLLGAGTATAVALASVGARSIAGTQADLDAAVRLAQATPQELARLAADGDERAQHVLDQARTSQRLLNRLDLTV